MIKHHIQWDEGMPSPSRFIHRSVRYLSCEPNIYQSGSTSEVGVRLVPSSNFLAGRSGTVHSLWALSVVCVWFS